MEALVTRNPKHRTACDRCYELKERCDRTSTSTPCARCQRLDLTCSTVRPVQPVGRRARHEKSLVSRTTASQRRSPQQHQPDIDSWLNMLPDQQPGEKELILFLLNQPGSLDHYVVCPSFQAEKQQLLAVQLSSALPFLKDALLACAVTLKQLQSGTTTDGDPNISVSYISKAMSALRSLPVLCSRDVVLCHALGSMLAFSIYSAIGVGVPDICRYCLGITSPFMGTTMSDSHKDPWQSFLVLLEIMDCLVYRKTPTLRIQTPASVSVVDCRLGLCLPLLPYYHDLCVINNSLLHTTGVNIPARLEKQLDDIHCAVEPWQPSHLDQLVEKFDSAEIIHLLAQAKVYRLGALLLGHRLRFPFGQEDAQAEIWSKEVMMELEMAKQVTKRPMRFVTLPFIVAAIEVQDDSLRLKALQHVDDWVDHFAPLLQKTTKIFLLRVWRERDLNPANRWFDSIYKPCPVLDSINETFTRS